MIELTAVATVAAKITPKLAGFFLRRRRLLAELEHDIEHIQRECSIIAAAITDDRNHQHASDAAVAHQEWIKIVRDLAYDIDDCIDRFIHRVSTATVADAGWIRRKAHRVKTVRARGKFAAAIARLRKRSDEASELRKKYTDLAYGDGRATAVFESRAPEAKPEPEPETYTDSPVGMEAPEEELMELIRGTSTQGEEPKEKLKVISIVGFGGIGKSQLAKRVYDTLDDEGQYQARAWVRAAEKGPEDLLQAILQELGTHTTTISASSSNSKLCATIQKRLGTQRFFIVIDDMREDFWVDIKDAFPVIPGVDSRVLVTTARQTIAMKSSSRDGHVYVMRTLADDHSRQLFCEEASLVYPPSVGDTKLSSEVIKRCDGLPLALVTTGRLLHGESRQEQWADLGGNLGEHLENNKKLASMNSVLIRSYSGLSKQHIKTCLLYLGIYPSGRPIRRGSLIRRWSAEGFIKAEHKRSAREVAVANFSELVDWSIIQPIDASGSGRAEVKACQTHGIMLEFLLHKSMCENFVTLLYDDVPPPSKVRWLSLHNGSAASSRINPNDVPFLRSLTIFGKAHKSVLNFSKYKLMRVLDLEECHEHMEDKHLKGICSNLVLLRYLSLRGASKITVLPKEVKKLQLLETLDVRGTNIDILPTQVMQLQSLLHLFGKFKLPQDVGGRKMRKLQAWLQEEENSKLQTVAGFVVDDKSQGFAQLMGEMKKLTKVKIWWESTTDASSYLSHLSEAIKEFIDRGTDQNKARSLSMNMNGAWSQDLLNFSLENDSSCYVSSLKLQGNNISNLPPFVSMLGGLTKLCLSFSHLQLSSGILEALNSVSGLKYLKLNATRLDNLVIKEDALGSLKRLCIVVEVMTGLVIEEGALPDLESLQLICKDLDGFSSTRIQSLPRLKEVALHDGVSEGTKEEWKGATKNHSRHPKLLFVTKQMVDDHFKPMGTEAAPEISPEATAVDAMVVGSEPVENSESSGAPPTDTALLVTTQPTTISTQESVQVVTSEMVDAQDLMGTESAMETSPVATSTDTTKKIDVESEHALNSESLVAPPTDMMLSMTTPSDAISTGESVQLNGGCQHNDEGKDLDNIEDPKDFATENGLSTQLINHMSKECYKVEMEGVACLEDLHMKDGIQKQGLKNKQRLRARLLSLVKIGVFRHTSRKGRLVHRLD
nr:disease resistance protein RGA4 isoform X1 [Aegilops tauschii subsp. strangulata]